MGNRALRDDLGKKRAKAWRYAFWLSLCVNSKKNVSCGFLASFFAWSSDSLFCQGFLFILSRKLYGSPILHESLLPQTWSSLFFLFIFWHWKWYMHQPFRLNQNDAHIHWAQHQNDCYCCSFEHFQSCFFKWKFFFKSLSGKSDEPFLVERARNVNSIFSRPLDSFVRLIRFREEASQKGLTLECKKRDFKKKKIEKTLLSNRIFSLCMQKSPFRSLLLEMIQYFANDPQVYV